MTEDNLALQADEVEALSSIYGDDWCVIDEVERIFCICIQDRGDNPRWTLRLQVHMSDEYPSFLPPLYQLNAPWLRGEERKKMEAALAAVYFQNANESIIYLWVEEVRRLLSDKPDSVGNREARITSTTEETELGDNFDSIVLGSFATSISIEDEGHVRDVDLPEIFHGQPMTDRRSTFQAHMAAITNKVQVNLILDKLKENKKIANATHNICAYRLERDETSLFQGCDDDGETHAGSRMLHLLQLMDAVNVLVVVSRWYGGIQLGADRFKHINNCTRTILDEHGFIQDKGNKKKAQKHKKGK